MVRLARFSRKKLKSGKTSLKYDKPGKKLKEGRLLEAVGELDNKLQLEAKLKRALTKYMDPRRRELKKLLGNPPDINNVPAKFWKEAEKEFQEQLAIALILLWDDAALGFGLDSDRASSYAQTRANELAGPFISHSKDRLQSVLASGERPTASQLGAIFGKPRAETVAQYETGLAQRDVGQEWRKREEERGDVLRAIWRHSKEAPRGHAGASKDPCQICTPLLDTDEAVWSLVAPNGPPVHPWCDCYLEYVSTGKRLNESFCPTGEGGGIDNSCGGEGGSGGNSIKDFGISLASQERIEEVDRIKDSFRNKQGQMTVPEYKEDVALKDIVATQNKLHPEVVKKYISKPEVIQDKFKGQVSGVRLYGKVYLEDGHHRLAAAKKRGERELAVQVVDLDAAIRKKREVFPDNINEAFCPTGEGGGIDNSCGSGDGTGPSPDASFPSSMKSLKASDKKLGGESGAKLVEDEHGKKYVAKRGTSNGHVRSEYQAEQLYRAMGVSVPSSKLLEEPDGPVKLSVFLEGAVSLKDLQGQAREDAKAKIRANFVADALMANWDVIGPKQDNIMITKDGTPFRIDVGGSLSYGGLGGPKGSKWNTELTELDTMRSALIAPTAAPIFGSITDDEIRAQAKTILAKKDKILAAIPPEQTELRKIMEGRLATLEKKWGPKEEAVAQKQEEPKPEKEQPKPSKASKPAPKIKTGDNYDALGAKKGSKNAAMNAHLSEDKPTHVGTLAKLLGVSPGHVYQNFNSLEKKGLVEKKGKEGFVLVKGKVQAIDDVSSALGVDKGTAASLVGDVANIPAASSPETKAPKKTRKASKKASADYSPKGSIYAKFDVSPNTWATDPKVHGTSKEQSYDLKTRIVNEMPLDHPDRKKLMGGLNAVTSFTGSSSSGIRHAELWLAAEKGLIPKKPDHDSKKPDPLYLRMAEDMNAAISSFPEDKGYKEPTYRGLHGLKKTTAGRALLEAVKSVGNIIQWHNTSSSSRKFKKAEDFTSGMEDNLIIRILGKTGVPVESSSLHEHEAEVFLRAGKRYIVRKAVEKVGGNNIVTIEELED